MSAILDRQGLLVAAPVDFRTKKGESVSAQLLKVFWSNLKKKKKPKIVVMSLNWYYEEFSAERSHMATAPFMVGGRASNPLQKHFLILGPASGEIWWLKKGTIPSEKIPMPMGTLARQEPQDVFFFFHYFGNLSRPLEFGRLLPKAPSKKEGAWPWQNLKFSVVPFPFF